MFSSYKKKISLQVRQAGTWDPLLRCCKACICIYLTLSHKIQRNFRGLKLTLRTQLRQILEQKIQRHFWRSGCKIRVVRMSPLHTILPKGYSGKAFGLEGWLSWFAHPLSHPSSPKSLPELLVWPLANFYWLEKAKNGGWYHKCWIRSYFTVPSVTSVSFLGVTDCKVQLHWNFSWLRDSRSSYTFPPK